jgi:hypothetical protein
VKKFLSLNFFFMSWLHLFYVFHGFLLQGIGLRGVKRWGRVSGVYGYGDESVAGGHGVMSR